MASGLRQQAGPNLLARLPSEAGQRLVYVDYLESAPWNVKPLAEAPRYGAVGARLIAAAVRVSLEAGLGGRAGLHSLPQAEAFYAGVCGMTPLGADPDYETLTYFELTRGQAEVFIDKEGGK